ncbi:putative zinc finger MYND domain protein [Paratrimastix pyriformis]|uniref:Zinc finger MYND domain protein n=1 Tax=Paratrimastix pyriformis TaxID=342808 RepID=A0ABQ8US60_9EUKA|nr:putative zinc finger MYND domain protein [Paratrimastix pyriformis]
MEDQGLTTFEAEQLIKGLHTFETIRAVGSEDWLAQHQAIEKLNMQAHYCAQKNSDEFVVEEFQTHDKVGTLIHDLVLIDVWKEKVAPLLNLQEPQLTGVKAYMTFYHEGLVVNLLEILCYNRDALLSAGDMLIELAEYLIRKLEVLATRPASYWATPKRTPAETMAMTAVDRHHEQVRQIEFNVCMGCLGVTRLLTDQAAHVPPGVLDCFLVHHDLISLLVQLMESKPWVRRDGADTFKFEDTQWVLVPPRDRLRLPKLEAQVWLSLYRVLLERDCQAKYRFDDLRKATIGKLRRYFQETLLDQLPVLTDLQRGIEYLTVQGAPPDERRAPLRIEELPEVRSSLSSGQNWTEIAAWQREHVFTQTEAQRLAEMRRLAANYSMPIFEEAAPKPRCACCGRMATQRCARCRSEWYCDRECQIRRWPDHKKACAEIAARLPKEEPKK